MTSEEIRKEMKGPITNLVTGGVDASVAFWLAEIAYQLALMNEREAARPEPHQVAVPKAIAELTGGRFEGQS